MAHSKMYRTVRRSKRSMVALTAILFMALISVSLISGHRGGSAADYRSKSKSKVRFIDTLSSEQRERVLRPGGGGAGSRKNDEFFAIDENPNQIKIDLSVLSNLNMKNYKRELRQFQSKYGYLKYDEESIAKFFKQNPPNYIESGDLGITKERQIFYTRLFETILSHAPAVKPLKKYQSRWSVIKDYAMQAYYERFSTEPTLDEHYLGSHGLTVTSSDRADLKEKHAAFLASLQELKPDLKYGHRHQNGIVYVGGGKFTFLALLSIVSLRESGSDLPVEVLIPNNIEHEPEFCDVHFPKLNAKCILLSQNLAPEIARKIEIAGYQYKSIALLMSSFENVLLLDSDSFVIRNPDQIFETDPFSTTGMVVWPDYWRRVTHPAYYDIASLTLEKARSRYGIDKFTFAREKLANSWFSNKAATKIPLHDRANTIPDPSSETGQLLINKKTHLNSILLSLYYNYYGPDYYYPLFSQGTQGEGDKETFIAAAHALDEPFYQINKRVEACGYWEDNTFTGTGMFQFDPITDYLNLQRFLGTKKQKTVPNNNDNYDPLEFPNFFTKDNSKMLFLHNNYPKIDPYRLIKDGNLIEKNADNKITKMIRLFGPVDTEHLGKDLELMIWKYVSFYLCEMKIYLRAWNIDLYNEEMNRNDVCHFISRHLEFLNKYEQNAIFS